MLQDLYVIFGSWIIIILATERTTEIINDSKLFFPLRNWVTINSISGLRYRRLFIFINDVLTCAWCLSVWVSMFFCWFLPGGHFEILAPHNILVKWLALVGAANLWHALFRLVFRGRVITVDINHTFVDDYENREPEEQIVIGDGNGEH